jgi:hypothetical protein
MNRLLLKEQLGVLGKEKVSTPLLSDTNVLVHSSRVALG